MAQACEAVRHQVIALHSHRKPVFLISSLLSISVTKNANVAAPFECSEDGSQTEAMRTYNRMY